ncbi:hypothetical protein M5X06_00380 [Paenibacillus alvei]|uniref:Uncharacterized protein n=1 Tax=Paenibacillus alvei TaxID=44250 RepID=A0ABT4H4H0_PAEAL|nr:hypothetical protein [Paenibacillus alvei]MCY9763521.1 hypothetical protein [Paenibacillus alvei]MCY9765292.1 hypothetical protein [Paenibacillus alvei]
MKNAIKYVKGETIEQFGSTYLVEDVYQLSDEYMKLHSLVHKNRVTLKKVSGENGLEKLDFAIPA